MLERGGGQTTHTHPLIKFQSFEMLSFHSQILKNLEEVKGGQEELLDFGQYLKKY